MNRFRPNLVFSGPELPHEEDRFQHFFIGQTPFCGVKPCARCAIPTTDQETGLRAMSFAVGFSDITPFVVSVLQGNLGLADAPVVQAIVIASASNNLLKAAYTIAAASPRTARLAGPCLIALALASGLYALGWM